MDYKEIVRAHQEAMNSNYYNDEYGIVKEEEKYASSCYNLPPFYFTLEENPSYNTEIYSLIPTIHNRNKVSLIIKTNFLTIYGTFAARYDQYYDETSQSEYWNCKSLNNSTWENPYMILCCLIENTINPQLVPKSIESISDNHHILLKFTNNTSLYIDKTSLTIKNRIEEQKRKLNENESEEDSDDMQEYSLSNQLKSDFIKENIQREISIKETTQAKEPLDSNLTIENNIKAFKELLKEKEITPASSYDRIEMLIKYDKRYKAISSPELRYSLFKELQASLQQISKQSEVAALQRQKHIKDFKLLLKRSIETGELDLTTTLASFSEANGSNPAFSALSEIDREFIFNGVKLSLKKLFDDNKKRLKDAFISFLSQHHPIEKISNETTIESIKSALKGHKEYLILPSKTERTEVIGEYLNKMKALLSVNTSGISLFKANNDLVSTLQAEYDIREFNKLLEEKVKNEMSWEETMSKLKTDSRWMKLAEEKRKELFKGYIMAMITLHQNEYKQLLEEKIGLNEEITWHDAQHLLQRDPKYKNVQEKEREAIFNEYKADMLNRIMSQFEQLIEERTDLINKDIPIEGPQYDNLVNALNSDIRAQRTMRHPDKRDKLLRMKIKSIKYKHEKEKREQRKLLDKQNSNEKRDLMKEKWEKGHVIK